MRNITLKSLDWDSGLLGVKCGLIDATGSNLLTNSDVLTKQIKALCGKRGFEFIVIKVPHSFTGTADSIIKYGASLINSELSFSYSGKPAFYSDSEVSDKLRLEFCKEFEGDAFISLAKEMRFSRFFHDPRISRNKALHLWKESIKNHCGGLKDQLLIAYYDGKPCGIVTIEFRGVNKIRLFLVGVLKRYRGKDIAKTMLKAIIARYSAGCSIHVETQAENVIARDLYQSAGFKLENMTYVLHYWKTDGPDRCKCL